MASSRDDGSSSSNNNNNYDDALTHLEMLCRMAEMNLALIVAEHDVDLSTAHSSNTIYVLELDAGERAAGGRVAGFGSRRFKMVHCFRLEGGRCVERYHEGYNYTCTGTGTGTGGGAGADSDVEIGYIARLPVRLSDGSEVMASCSIDAYTVSLLNSKFGIV
ncbi:MAG: hypothetical protein NZ888_04015 [Candidatus Nitrosocaldus sp.]|nr:hypothetical protein [Candidatus Nitrosocaldus sp.]MDW8000298.1 hypothetical protein [Candidatus Nitrosocaldus sp.]